MDHASRGAAALAASDGQTAVTAYTKALIEHPSSPDYFVQRSTAFVRLKAPLGPRNDLALKDAEYAVLLGQKRAKREKIQAGQQRRVVALLGLARYGDAGFILQKMERWRLKESKRDKMEGDIWKAKIEQRSRGIPPDDGRLKISASEFPDFQLPSEGEVKKMLQSQLKADGTFKFDGDEDSAITLTSTTDNTSGVTLPETDTVMAEDGAHLTMDEQPIGDTKLDTQRSASTTTASAPIAAPQTLSKIRHEFFQNAESVTVTIYAKGVQKDKAEIMILEDSVSLSFPHPSDPSSSWIFTLDPLFALIDPSTSRHSIMSTKIEFVLHKQIPGQKWPALEGNAPLKNAEPGVDTSAAKAALMSGLGQPPVSLQPQTAPSYPTSSKSGPKNWDKLATDLTAKKKKTKKSKKDNKENNDGISPESSDADEVDSDYETGDAVDGFFKKLYAGADDDTRRAMMKSFQESNGTALSTNWGEVGKGKVEPVKSKDDN